MLGYASSDLACELRLRDLDHRYGLHELVTPLGLEHGGRDTGLLSIDADWLGDPVRVEKMKVAAC